MVIIDPRYLFNIQKDLQLRIINTIFCMHEWLLKANWNGETIKQVSDSQELQKINIILW